MRRRRGSQRDRVSSLARSARTSLSHAEASAFCLLPQRVSWPLRPARWCGVARGTPRAGAARRPRAAQPPARKRKKGPASRVPTDRSGVRGAVTPRAAAYPGTSSRRREKARRARSSAGGANGHRGAVAQRRRVRGDAAHTRASAERRARAREREKREIVTRVGLRMLRQHCSLSFTIVE
jgi:hypothetical protein